MFDFTEIRKLVELVQSSDIGELEVSRFLSRVKIRKVSAESRIEAVAPPAPAVPPAPVSQVLAPEVVEEPPEEEPEQDLVAIRSPMVGTFYKASAPDAKAFAEVGERVSRGQVVCVIEAMKLMNEIESEVEGTVVKVLVGNAEPVQYDQTLFLIRSS